jgi:adenine/guanine phosphoribosyltransferase-like PRPP-binding protein
MDLRPADADFPAYQRLLATIGARDSHRVAETDFELVCTLEQFLADLSAECSVELPACTALRSAAVALARHLWFGGEAVVSPATALKRSVASLPRAAELVEMWRAGSGAEPHRFPDTTDAWVVWPDCRAGCPVDYQRYARCALESIAEWIPPGSETLVIGVRSSGSHLGPIWAAAALASGSRSRFVSVRPPRQLPAGMFERRTGEVELPALASLGRAGQHVIIVDDLVGTGSTLSRVVQATRQRIDAGAADIHVSIGTEHGKDVVHDIVARRTGVTSVRVLGAEVRLPSREGEEDRAADEEALLAWLRPILQRALDRSIAVVDIEALAPGFEARFLAEKPAVPAAALAARERANRRYRATFRAGDVERTVVVKPLGPGIWGRHEEARLRSLPHLKVMGVVDGLLLSEWIPGCPLPFGRGCELSDRQIHELGAAMARAHALLDRRMLVRDALFGPLGHSLHGLEALGAAQLPDERRISARIREDRVPVVLAPGNEAHWHVIVDAEGDLHRLGQDLAHGDRRIDPAEDVAAVALELGLDGPRTAALLSAYAGANRERISAGRLAAGALRHMWRTLTLYEIFEVRARELAADGPAGEGPLHRRREALRGLGPTVSELLYQE